MSDDISIDIRRKAAALGEASLAPLSGSHELVDAAPDTADSSADRDAGDDEFMGSAWFQRMHAENFSDGNLPC